LTRLTGTPDESAYDADDRAALALLRGPLGGSGLEPAYSGAERPAVASGAAAVQQSVAALAPMAEVAFRGLAAATMKGQARGRFSRALHEWTDQVLAFDLSHENDLMLLGSHLPLAIAAGIDPDAIQALREGRIEELGPDVRQHLDFIRGVVGGTVTDECWQREVELVGGERGTMELMCLVIQLFGRIRIAQAIGAKGMTNDELDAMLGAFRREEAPVPDIAAYERFYDGLAWPPGGSDSGA
jgi:hypothetical protein